MKKIQHLMMVLTLLVSFTLNSEANQNCQTEDCAMIKEQMTNKIQQIYKQLSVIAKENNISKEMILSKFDSYESNKTNKELVQKGTGFCSDMFITMFELPFNVFKKLTEDATVLSVEGK